MLAASSFAALGLGSGDPDLLDAVKRRDRESRQSAAWATSRMSTRPNPTARRRSPGRCIWMKCEHRGPSACSGREGETADEYGETPLDTGLLERQYGSGGEALKAGANAKAARWNGETAMMIAAGAGSAESVKLLAAARRERERGRPRKDRPR